MYFRRVRSPIRKIFAFIGHGIWTIDIEKLNRRNRYLVKLLRIILIAIKDFKEKKLILQASALTFYSLLSLVPVIAMIFGIAKGFGLEERLRQELFRAFEKQPELLEQVLAFVNKLLANTQGGLVAGFGFVLLLWSVLQVLSNVEMSFNTIWQVSASRTWVRKFTDYLSIMLIAPLFIIASGSATIFISAFITEFAQQWISFGLLKELIIFSIKFLPYLLSAILFTLIYMVMPNTRVEFRSALVAGIVAGSIFQLFQWGYVEFQVGVSRLNAIYGSFAFFPLFITFLQIAWVIVLIGAEVSYSLQNIDLHVDDRQHFTPSNKDKLIMAMAILTYSARRFQKGEEPVGSEELAEYLDLPYKPVKEFCQELCRANLLSEVLRSHKNGNAYQPAVSLQLMDIAYIMHQLDQVGDKAESLHLSPVLKRFASLVDRIYEETRGSSHNIHISDLLEND